MLGYPETLVAERLDMPCEVEGIVQRLTGAAAFGDWRKVQYGKWDHRRESALHQFDTDAVGSGDVA